MAHNPFHLYTEQMEKMKNDIVDVDIRFDQRFPQR